MLAIAILIVTWATAGCLGRYLAYRHSMSRWGRNIHTNKVEQYAFGYLTLLSAICLWAFFPSKPAR